MRQTVAGSSRQVSRSRQTLALALAVVDRWGCKPPSGLVRTWRGASISSSSMTIPVVAVALLFWVCVFMIYFTSAETTPIDFFFGRYEAPPADLGTWKNAGVDATGLICEERCLLPEGRVSASYLLHQVRYRDPITRGIVRVEPERRLARRRTGRTGRSD
jgi:hypothetical protein